MYSLPSAALHCRQRTGGEAKTPLVCALHGLLGSAQPEPEVLYRGVVALGTLVDSDAETAELCVGLDLPGTLRELTPSSAPPGGAAAQPAAKLRAVVGEVLQLMNIGNPDISEAQYLDVIDRKTARLFRAATMLPALLAGSSQPQIDAMDRYGQSLGMAFQLVDDALDYLGDESSLGKHVGDDLAEGKPTLPLLRVLRDGSPAAQARVRRAITEATDEELDAIIQDIHAAGAIDQTLQLARHYADAAVDALDALPATPGRDTLAGLARFAVERVS